MDAQRLTTISPFAVIGSRVTGRRKGERAGGGAEEGGGTMNGKFEKTG